MSETSGGQGDASARRETRIVTVAGNGHPDYTGDNCDATTTSLYRPCGVATDAFGNLYIADCGNHRVRKVDVNSGRITTVAGTGQPDFNGDKQRAVDANLSKPTSVAVDSVGNLYIADCGNHRVRKVDVNSGRITTVAGTGDPGFDDGDQQADKARLNYPNGVAVDSAGNLYIADTSNYLVRKVDAESGAITTVAGNHIQGFNGDKESAVDAKLSKPTGVAVDSVGDLYVVDGDRVRKVDMKSGGITTVASTDTGGFNGDDHQALDAQGDDPRNVAVDLAGNVFIADSKNHRVRKVDTESGVITTVVGDGTTKWQGDGAPADKFSVASPHSVAVTANGDLYIGDTDHHRVRKVTGVFPGGLFSVRPAEGRLVLSRGCGTRYPGVLLSAEADGTIPLQQVSVVLPTERGLQFVAEGKAGDHELTVRDHHDNDHFYPGILDGQALTFTRVDLGLSGKGSTSRAWVAVSASVYAPLGETHLSFTVGIQHSLSTTVEVVDQSPFRVTPSEQTSLKPGGLPAYPGVTLRAEGKDTSCQEVTVSLPTDEKLYFAEAGLAYPLYVQSGTGDKRIVPYRGKLSEDGQSVFYSSVDLALSGPNATSRAWVAVNAGTDAPTGKTHLSFTVGIHTSPSGSIEVS